MREPQHLQLITTEFPGNPQYSDTALRDLLAVLAEHNVSTLDETRALLDRADELHTARTALPENARDKRTALVDALAASETTVDSSAAELAAADTMTGSDKLPALLDQAHRAAHRQAWRIIADHGEALITDLRPAVEALVAEAILINADLPGTVTNAATALAAGDQAAARFQRLGEINRAWHRAHDVLDDLRARVVLPSIDEAETYHRSRPCFDPARYRYTRPDLLADDTMRTFRHLARAVQAGAEPSAYTVDDVRERNARRRAATETTEGEPAAVW